MCKVINYCPKIILLWLLLQRIKHCNSISQSRMYEKRKLRWSWRLHRSFICQAFAMLRNVQQCKLCLSPFEQHGVPFTFVVAESDILPINVSVARFQFSDQRAFGYLPAPQKPVWTDIVGERGKEQTVTPELAEHGAELPQVFPQERVRLPLRHGACRISFTR